MCDMAPRSARQRLSLVLRCLLGGAFLTVGAAACTGAPDQPQPDVQPAALEVKIVSGADGLDETAKAEVETGIGDVLSSYVVRGFLGDYPRDDFVRAFDSFTSGAAKEAAQDIDLLTAARFSDATKVAATQLTARISCLVDGQDVVGATANVSFAFEATVVGDGPLPFSLEGRLMLVRQGGDWVVFGYDVAPHDGSRP
jgi:hypothetical protein